MLVLGSKPPCDIAIDGVATGLHTPQQDIKLPVGRHTVTLTNAEFNIKDTFSVDVKADSPAKLEHAKARTELGAALRRHNLRSAARDQLRRAVELATICGAAPLAARAEAELLATGARPRRIALTGLESLTPSERRVAEMAAEGPTNRQIAQAPDAERALRRRRGPKKQ